MLSSGRRAMSFYCSLRFGCIPGYSSTSHRSQSLSEQWMGHHPGEIPSITLVVFKDHWECSSKGRMNLLLPHVFSSCRH